MTVVCDSWSLVPKEQGNSLPFLCLYLERSLCSLHTCVHTHTHTHTHTLLAVTLSSEQTLRKPSSVREPLLAEQRGKRQRNSPEREERGHFLMGGSGFKPPSWQASALLKCA